MSKSDHILERLVKVILGPKRLRMVVISNSLNHDIPFDVDLLIRFVEKSNELDSPQILLIFNGLVVNFQAEIIVL